MTENSSKKVRVRYYVEKESFGVKTAVVCMLLSAIFRLIGSWGLWGDAFFAVTQIALPLVCNLLFVLCILYGGRKLLALSSVPVILGAVFFIIKSTGFESWIHMCLCILLYVAAACIYTATVFGYIKTKWLLPPLFGLPFLYHIFIEDLARLRDTANPVSLSEGMQEISVLCIMLALFFTAIAIKKQKKPIEEQELPKMKAPKVIKPEDKPAAAESPAEKSENTDKSAVKDANRIRPEIYDEKK